MRFNGPARSNDETAIASDLKIMKIMNVSGRDKDKDKDKEKDKGSDKDKNKVQNHHDEIKETKETKDDQQQLSSKCLVDQLPNTVCMYCCFVMSFVIFLSFVVVTFFPP